MEQKFTGAEVNTLTASVEGDNKKDESSDSAVPVVKNTKAVGKEKLEKFPLLLFSGGLDSTYMLQLALRKSDVDVLYVDGGQGDEKIKAEEVSRERVIKYLRNEYYTDPTKKTIHHDYSRKVPSFANSPGTTLAQAPAWLFGALYHIDPDRHSCLQIAYVLGDDAATMWHEIAYAWDNLTKLSKFQHVPIEFPLLHHSKQNILQYIDKNLLDLVWSCETPKWVGMTLTQCGNCRPCKRAKREQEEFQNPSEY